MIRLPSRLVALALGLAMTPLLGGCDVDGTQTLEEAAQARWADVQAQYLARARLAASIVPEVQAATGAEEAEALRRIAADAAKASPFPPSPTDEDAFRRYRQAQVELNWSLTRLTRIAARHPALRSNTDFLILYARLTAAEGRIAVARIDYNEAASEFNEALTHFPASLLSGGRPRMAVFAADPPEPPPPPAAPPAPAVGPAPAVPAVPSPAPGTT
ncbi:LemA family protein [Brevundimonas sp. FT23028]|uniref:LemA family protein n=1 Tax=Brevundimonas sp. FT23028 TaxID=3393748 RepID=UPI003B585B2C